MQSSEYPDLPFVSPRAWGSGRAGYQVQYIVVHYTAGSERSTSAEDGAAYDQRRTDGTSTHYFVDSNSVVQCVLTRDRANAAFQYGNRLGIQYELCGTVQSRQQWLDPASDATLTNAARQMARDCRKYGLPARQLTTAQMRNGEKGICGHVDVTNAYGLGDHTDPGPEFPWDVLLQRVSHFLGSPQEDDMAFMDDKHAANLAWRVSAEANGSDTIEGGEYAGEDHWLVKEVRRIGNVVNDLQSRPAVAPAPIDAATLAAALQDPAVQAVLKAAAQAGAEAAEDS